MGKKSIVCARQPRARNGAACVQKNSACPKHTKRKKPARAFPEAPLPQASSVAPRPLSAPCPRGQGSAASPTPFSSSLSALTTGNPISPYFMSLPETDDASRYANQLQKEKTVVLLNLPHTRGRPMPGRTAAMPVAKSSRTGRAHANPAFAPDARADGKPRARIERILNAQAPSNERAQAAAGLSTPAHIAPASATQPRPSLSALPGTKVLPYPHSPRMDMRWFACKAGLAR